MRSKVNLLEFTSSAGRTLPVVVRRRKGTRHLRLSLNLRNQIVVSLPWHASERVCLKFIDQNRQWLEQQIAAVPEVAGLRAWLAHSPYLTAAGVQLRVQFQEASSGRAAYSIGPDSACVHLHLPRAVDDAFLDHLVRRFAKDVLSERTASLAGRHGLSFHRLSVRNQSSRWGSCSSKRVISLNWRLVLIEPALQDYIILHELAHLTEMNHSRRFWRLLSLYDPMREAHEAQLDALTPTVMRVCPGRA